MRVLWIATKPPWPPVDGGRLVQKLTLEALLAQGAEVTLVAPRVGTPLPPELVQGELPGLRLHLVPGGPRPLLRALPGALGRARSLSLVRHRLPRVRQKVAELLDTHRFDVVHVEQLQAWAQSAPAAGRLPRLLRAQNVESDLWAGLGQLRSLRGIWARREARLLARAEGEIVAAADGVVALTREDGERLADLSGGRHVEVVPPPFPARLPAAAEPLTGDPAVVLFGSGGWLPNREATRWFLEVAWPRVVHELPGAMLHVFGGGGKGYGPRIVSHPPPADSRSAFAPGSVLVVPLRIGSGIRMKILEAWARGIPVVASPTAAAGLDAVDGETLLLAREVREFAVALGRLYHDERLLERLIVDGRRLLARRFGVEESGRRLLACYGRACDHL